MVKTPRQTLRRSAALPFDVYSLHLNGEAAIFQSNLYNSKLRPKTRRATRWHFNSDLRFGIAEIVSACSSGSESASCFPQQSSSVFISARGGLAPSCPLAPKCQPKPSWYFSSPLRPGLFPGSRDALSTITVFLYGKHSDEDFGKAPSGGSRCFPPSSLFSGSRATFA